MITVKSAGDAALLLETRQDGNVAASLAAAVRAAAVPGVIDIVPGASTVLVSFEPCRLSAADLAAELRRLGSQPAGRPPGSGRVTEIDVVYNGPDLAGVAALTGLTPGQLIERHQAASYQVGWLGFSPGFGYLTGLDPVLAAVPRRGSPRVAVPAGSVAIAGGLAAVYPAASPGGWQLLGRTAARLWDPAADPPAVLAPGMTVRFRAVDRLPELAPGESGAEAGAAAGAGAGAGAGARAGAAGARLVEVLQPGPLTTIQDPGRAGLAHLGVPGSGAADRASLRRANWLAGNDSGAAGLEITLGRLALRFGADAVIALTGAPAPIRLTGPAAVAGAVAGGGSGTGGGSGDGAAEPAPHDTAIAVRAGTVLRLGPPAAGLRSYLAVSGGIDAPPVLGSRSADLLSGLGPSPLRPGDWLRAGRPRSRPEEGDPARAPASAPALRPPGELVTLRAMTGPRDDWFTAGAVRALFSASYQVTAASNRAGLRLEGPPLPRSRPGELPSEGVATGSLQVTHDGQPILLLADHPVTGGYPVIAVVVSADIPAAAQLRPGQHVRFANQPASSR